MFNHIEWKFRAPNQNTLATLINKELWYSSPKLLNDPFESNFDLLSKFDAAYSDYTAIATQKGNARNLVVNATNTLDEYNIGICSLCKNYKPTPMWSYYAENHTGLALGFKFDKKRLNFNEFAVIRREDVKYLDSYGKNIHFASWIDDVSQSQNFSDNDLSMLQIEFDIFNFLLSVKGTAWKHESEVRYWLGRKRSDESIFHGYPIKFANHELKHVIFGLKSDPKFQKTIIKLLSDNDVTVDYWQAIQNFNTMEIDVEAYTFT